MMYDPTLSETRMQQHAPGHNGHKTINMLSADLCEKSEELLVLNKFTDAEEYSHEVLSRCNYCQNETERTNLADRAGCVLLQALYETNRFSLARHQLNKAFGTTEVDNWPINPLLLWLSLSLDTEDKPQAQSIITRLLETKKPGTEGWTRQRYLALLHLYIMEVLIPALKDPSEAKFWLQKQSYLKLEPHELEYLETDIDAAYPGGHNFVSFSSGDHSKAVHRRRSSAGVGTTSTAGAWLKREEHLDDGDPEEADDDNDALMEAYMAAQQNSNETPPASRSLNPSATTSPRRDLGMKASSAADIKQGKQVMEATTGGSRHHDPPAPTVDDTDLDWLGRWQLNLFNAASTVYATVFGSSASKQSPTYRSSISNTGGASTSGSSSQLNQPPSTASTTTTAAAVALVCAAYIAYSYKKDGTSPGGGRVSRARASILSGLSDIGRMALSLNVNPMMAPR